MPFELPIPQHRRIALAANEEFVRRAVASALAAAGLGVDAATDLEAMHRLALAAPSVLVLAADLTRSRGLAALRRARRDLPTTRIVVVSTSERGSMAARHALNGGGDAFVPYTEIDRSLAAAVHASLAGLICAPRQFRRLIVKPTFSHREKEVLQLVVAGRTNHQIATQLFVAESTVKSHLSSVFAKLGVSSRKDAAALLLDPAEGLTATALPPDPAFDGVAS